MSEEKDQTVDRFVAQSNETPESTRVHLDHPTVQVVDEENLPESAKQSGTSESSQDSSDNGVCVFTHTEKAPTGDGLVVVEHSLDEDLIIKRTYIENPAKVPEGVDLQEGRRGGLYYEGSGQEFIQGQFERTQERLRDLDVPEEDIEEAISEVQKHDNIAQESFERVWNAAEDVGANITSGSHRVKGVGSAIEKVAESRENADEGEEPMYDSVSELTDVHGSKVVVDDMEDAEQLFNNLKEMDDIDVEKETNHAEDTDDPYRAFHVVMEVEDGVHTEVQIKEERMSQIADASHSLVYKSDREAPVEELESVGEEHLEYNEDLDKEVLTEDTSERIEDCLVDQADFQQGLIEEDDLECDEDTFNIIQEFMEVKGHA